MRNFFNVLFDLEDQVCAGNQYSTHVMTQAQAMHSGAPFVCINALAERRLDANVTKYRNFLIEIDDGNLTIQQHLERINNLNMPYSAATYSGGKSVHFVISLQDAVDETTWRSMADALIRTIPGADPATKNPSRFTRMPESIRLRPDGTEVAQRLIHLGGRIPNDQVRNFCISQVKLPKTDHLKTFNEFMGVTGIEAAHPMTLAFINGTHPCVGGRNNALYKSAADLRDCGLDMAETEEHLTGPALALGLTQREIIQTIRSAFRKSRVDNRYFR